MSRKRPQLLYLFDLKNGKQKLCYGSSPQDALECVRLRLTEEEMAQIIPDKFVKIKQAELIQYVNNLG